MNDITSKIENDIQDRNSLAWHRLCEYVEKVAMEKLEEFSPYEALGLELFSQIHTLPETISKLERVKKVWLYGSNLKRIPPEIGKMKSLKYFDPYTSYALHWFPYEITNCKKLIDSRVSTRVLYGNYKNRKKFPVLTHNPIRYIGQFVKCSICDEEISYEKTNQFWISLAVGTDVLPLLVNVCSEDCKNKLPKPPPGYVPYPHKGGVDLRQPSSKKWANATMKKIPNEKMEKSNENTNPKLIKIVKKIWEE